MNGPIRPAGGEQQPGRSGQIVAARLMRAAGRAARFDGRLPVRVAGSPHPGDQQFTHLHGPPLSNPPGRENAGAEPRVDVTQTPDRRSPRRGRLALLAVPGTHGLGETGRRQRNRQPVATALPRPTDYSRQSAKGKRTFGDKCHGQACLPVFNGDGVSCAYPCHASTDPTRGAVRFNSRRTGTAS